MINFDTYPCLPLLLSIKYTGADRNILNKSRVDFKAAGTYDKIRNYELRSKDATDSPDSDRRVWFDLTISTPVRRGGSADAPHSRTISSLPREWKRRRKQQ